MAAYFCPSVDFEKNTPCSRSGKKKQVEISQRADFSRNLVDVYLYVQLINSREHQLGLEGLVLAALFHSVSSCFNNGVALLCSNPLLIV